MNYNWNNQDTREQIPVYDSNFSVQKGMGLKNL